ncbi:biotin-dependent carboxyltransferase family protein [Primorskyibacter aestuariivivens]|uniref:5-oxoprolinase subunit C family protein n=1 Tax=Primorskyibacter aestuariivivens TaxID=1888912 RepID=UPI002301DC92|nr:biotin-dependent carboxyltransferase family protein [Primorskyibacter aestuariivivens]MDA7430161.1 biotin-dependent carboxyltransferase family protein [Primorskyibacter aestuariivivens]
MSRALIVHRAGPGVTVQDIGRPGYLAFGLSRGGAADRLALWEGAALLNQPETCAALELAGMGGTFEAREDMRIALTGAPMRATLDGSPLVWNASHTLPAGSKLEVGAAERGSYGYLHLGGGIATPEQLGSRAAHLAARIGAALAEGTQLPVGADTRTDTGLTLDPLPRFDGGTVRLVPSLQTDVFAQAEITRFEATTFRRDTRGNRMGVRLLPDGEGFGTDAGLNILSEVIVPGDVQVTGDGTPFVLLSECQTTGGYPRIGSVLPADLPRVAQARPGAELCFQFVTLDEAVEIERREVERRRALRKATRPLIRDPHDMSDLLSYRLVDGVIAGDEDN